MDRPAPKLAKDTPEAAPYYLSREYEDRLDWLENQRRDRTKRNRGSRLFLGFTSLFVSAFVFAGAMFRRR
jgi:hypothetical protein